MVSNPRVRVDVDAATKMCLQVSSQYQSKLHPEYDENDENARAYQMKDAGAYLHQYAEHGVGLGEFEEAFARVEDVLAAYRTL